MKTLLKNTSFFLFLLSLITSCSVSKEVVHVKDDRLDNLTEEDIFNITAQPKDFPLVMRRTTLIVRDLDTSLKLYRDAMGMEVIYDNKLPRPRKDGKEGMQTLRLVFLKATHKYYGVLGLMEYYYGEDIEEKPVRKEGFTAQNVVLLFNSQNIEEKLKSIKEIPGIEMVTEPKQVEYPSYGGGKPIRVKVSTFYDPDGFLVEFNELLDDL